MPSDLRLCAHELADKATGADVSQHGSRSNNGSGRGDVRAGIRSQDHVAKPVVCVRVRAYAKPDGIVDRRFMADVS